jgi:hypothetical protein
MFSLAKIKRRTKNHGFYKIGSELNFFNFNPSDYSLVSYDPNTLIEEGELYKIESFSSQDFFPPWLNSGIDSKDFNQIEASHYSSISYIIEVLQNKDFCFQLAGGSTYLRKKKFIELGDELRVEREKTLIIIKDIPDAYYEFASDTLVFSNLVVLDKIFDGASELYKAATDQQVQSFINNPCITLANGFESKKVSVLNRKKIALCLDSFSALLPADQANVLAETKVDAPDIVCKDTGNFIIGDDKALKLFLYGLQERYYTTKVGKEKRIANSVLKI